MSKKSSDRSTKRKSTRRRLLSLHSEEVKLNYNDLCPVFSFRHMRKKYSLEKCTPKQRQDFADRMVKLSQLTWDEITTAPRHGLGCEKIIAQEYQRRFHSVMYNS
jgi:hypothetical protein